MARLGDRVGPKLIPMTDHVLARLGDGNSKIVQQVMMHKHSHHHRHQQQQQLLLLLLLLQHRHLLLLLLLNPSLPLQALKILGDVVKLYGSKLEPSALSLVSGVSHTIAAALSSIRQVLVSHSNPKPEIATPNSLTLNLKPQTLNLKRAAARLPKPSWRL